MILNQLGIKFPILSRNNYPTLSVGLAYDHFLRNSKASKPYLDKGGYTLNNSNFIRNSKNTDFVYTTVVQPLFNTLNDSIYYSWKYIAFDTSSKEIIKEFSTYKEVSSFQFDTQIVLRVLVKVENDVLNIYDDKITQDITFGQSFNGVRRALRFLHTPESMVCEYARWTGVNEHFLVSMVHTPLCLAIGFFKKVKQTIHQFIEKLPPELRYFLDLDTLAGYPSMKNRVMSDDPVLWLSTPDASQYDRRWWSQAFNITFAKNIKRVPVRILTLKEFTVSRWLWVTDGASKYSNLYLDNELVKTKLGAAVSNSDEALLKAVYGTKNIFDPQQMIGVFIKPDEKGYKRRLIANVPLGFYIVASYIRYVLECYVGTNPEFMNLAPDNLDDVDVINLLRQGRISFPLDESAYDYHVTQDSWLGFIDFIQESIYDTDAVYLFKQYFGRAIWKFEDQSGVWISGMPSGLALTSYVNSWMNYIKQITILKGDINFAAGDDVLSFPFDERMTLDQVEIEYAKFGSIANATKNWTSSRYSEYLKTFYSSAGTSGYPARVFSSLLWAGTDRFFLPTDRMTELFELFKQFFDRVGINMPERYVAADLTRAVTRKLKGWSIKTTLEYMHAPKVHGGLGKWPYNDKTFSFEVSQVHESIYEGAIIRMPRVLRYYGDVTYKIGRYKINDVSYKLGKTYSLPPINTLEDWEKRLNREDVDYHGPFQSMILDTIPLPVVDFVSTARLSRYATQHGYNAYPNLTGSWNSCASRLLKASVALLEEFMSFVVDTRITTYC